MEEIINESKKIAGNLELDLYATDEELKEMVINMHNDNVPVETIAKYVNLPISEINRIISNKYEKKKV